MSNLWGIIFFQQSLLCGIALVSVHYRRKYEESKRYIEIIEMEDTPNVQDASFHGKVSK